MTDAIQNLAARYAQAIELEKSAWHALQAQAPGSCARAKAWAAWSEAISRTNTAWRQLSCQTLSEPRMGITPAVVDMPPFQRPAKAPPRLHH